MRKTYLAIAGAFQLRRDLKTAIEQMFRSVGNRPGWAFTCAGVILWLPLVITTPRCRAKPDAAHRVGGGSQRGVRGILAGLRFFSFRPRRRKRIAPGCRRNFDLVQLPVENPYELSTPGHCATTHPIGDLFALACCQIIIATPISSFHICRQCFGPATTCIIPPQKMRPGETPLCRVDIMASCSLTGPDISATDKQPAFRCRRPSGSCLACGCDGLDSHVWRVKLGQKNQFLPIYE